MALVVEDGTGLSNAESYISVADAIAYIAKYKGANSTWDSSTEATKEIAARVATQYLDGRYGWNGVKSSSTQALDFPRDLVYDERNVLIEGVPDALANATAEAMFLHVTGTDLFVNEDVDSHIKQDVTGPLSTTYKDNAPIQPSFPAINRLLSHLVSSSSKVYRG